MPDTVRYEAEFPVIGKPRLVLFTNGDEPTDISDLVSEIQINSGTSEKPSLVYVKQKPGASIITGEAVIYVNKERIDPLLVIQTIDPKELQETVLEKMEWGDDQTPSINSSYSVRPTD